MGAEFGLLQPYWMVLLPLPLLWWVWRRRRPRAWPPVITPPVMRYPLLAVIQPDAGAGRPLRPAGPDGLVTVALLLALVALAQPVHYTGEVATAGGTEPVDLVLVAATAISMTLSDYVVDGQRVDRMTMTRRLLDRFVAGYRGRRIGLVVLGDPPALWLPLTTDKGAVRDAVARLRTVLGGRLSDMGATLQLVGSGFRDAGPRVVVLVTDGGLQRGATAPDVAAQALAAAGDTLYVIGIGASDPAADAGDVGGLIYEPIDPVFLAGLAGAGGGRFFHARDAGAFSAALAAIEARHRQPQHAVSAERLVEPWYPLPLGLAMLALLGIALRPLRGLTDLRGRRA